MTSEPIQPFTPEVTKPQSGGCRRPALIGCGVLIVLLGVASIVFLLKAKDLFRWAIERFETEVMAVLPDDVSTAERQRLAAAFNAAIEAVTSGEADPLALQELQADLSRFTSRAGQQLSRQEVRELTLALERVAGIPPPDDADWPEVSPGVPPGEPPTG